MCKMASVQVIAEVKKIPDADRIVAYRVNGWWVVDQVGKYKVGDTVIFCEVDSWIPNEIAPFLSKGKEPRVYNGVPGEKLRTVKLKKQISQGLLLPIDLVSPDPIEIEVLYSEGVDVSEMFNIQKWEPPVNAQLAGNAKSTFPSWIPKTDQERCQNLKLEIKNAYDLGQSFEVTEKLEGSSCTIYNFDEESGVCSRNNDLKEDDTNAFWKIEHRYNIISKLKELGLNYAVQGELVGPSIQKNIYSLLDIEFFVFDIYDINNGEYLTPDVRQTVCVMLNLKHVPVVNMDFRLNSDSIEELLTLADGQSVLYNTLRKGLVFKDNNGGFSFKAVSNQYLLKNDL